MAKGLSIWDTFSRRQRKIKGGGKPTWPAISTTVQGRPPAAKALGFGFPFVPFLSRILPEGTGRVNKEGIAFTTG